MEWAVTAFVAVRFVCKSGIERVSKRSPFICHFAIGIVVFFALICLYIDEV